MDSSTNIDTSLQETVAVADGFDQEQLGPATTRTEVAPALSGGAKNWIKENPGQMALLVASTITMIVPGILSGPIIWMMGFGSSGPILGFLAPVVQSIIGDVRAKSLFAVLQSAAMGGYGTTIVNAVVRSVAGLIPTIWGAIKSWFWGKK